MNDNNELNNLNESSKLKASNKALKVIVVLLVLILIGLCVFIFMDGFKTNTKNTSNDTTTTTITTTKAENDVDKDITISEEDKLYRESVTNMINTIIGSNKVDSSKDYLNDEDFKFMFFVYLTKEYSENTEKDLTGQAVTGCYSMSLDSFNSHYLKMMGSNFDINKLNKNSVYYKSDVGTNYPTVKDNTIYSGYVTGPDPTQYQFKYSKTMYNEYKNLYTDVVEFGKTEEKGDSLELVSTGKAYLVYSKDPKGIISYKSFKLV